MTSLVSLGLYPDAARRMGRVIRHDFTFMFFAITTVSVGLRLLILFVHGE